MTLLSQVERHCSGITWTGFRVIVAIAVSYQRRQTSNIGYCCWSICNLAKFEPSFSLPSLGWGPLLSYEPSWVLTDGLDLFIMCWMSVFDSGFIKLTIGKRSIQETFSSLAICLELHWVGQNHMRLWEGNNRFISAGPDGLWESHLASTVLCVLLSRESEKSKSTGKRFTNCLRFTCWWAPLRPGF